MGHEAMRVSRHQSSLEKTEDGITIIGGLRISLHCMQPTTGVLTMWHTSYSQDSGRMRSDPRCAMLAGTCRSKASFDRKEGKLRSVPSEPTMTSILRSSLGHLLLVTMIPHYSSSYSS